MDLGCGKGGALITLAQHPFARVTGVDLSPDLLRVAGHNIRNMGLDHVDLHRVDAVEFDLDDYDDVYLHNPFPCNVMQAVMGNLVDSIRRRPRRLTIVYNTPHDTIVSPGGFEKVGEYPSGPSLPPFSSMLRQRF